MIKPRLAYLVVVIALIAGCGPSAEQKRQTTLRYTLTGVNAARDGFVAWDQVHQDQIAESASSLAEGEKALAEYRAKRAFVEKAFEGVYRSVAVAALELNAASLIVALSEARSLYDLLKELTGKDFKP